MTLNIDTALYKLINQQLTAEWLDFLMVKFSDKFFWIPFYCIVIFFMSKSHGKKTIILILFWGLSILFADRLTSGLMKPWIKRERPCHVAELSPRVIDPCNNTGSMPSSHAANHFAIALLMIGFYGFKKDKNSLFWLLWAAAIAYSRVYCGVHYPSDVLVGGIIGAAIGLACYYGYQLTIKKLKWD